MAATPGDDLNWLEDIEMLTEDGYPAVFDRYSNSFMKIYFRRARRVAKTRLQGRCSSSTYRTATPTASL